MRYAIIKESKVINIAVATPEFAAEQGWIEAGDAKIGDDYMDGVFVTPPIDPAPIAEAIRAQRNQLLTQSDWTQMPDAPVDQAAWATYRQALRDIPQQEGFPFNVVWPTSP